MSTKGKVFGIGLFAALLLAALFTGYAYAQRAVPILAGLGPGWMNGMHQWMFSAGGMHNLVWENLAEVLDMTTDELYAEINSGKTLSELGEEKGLSREELVVALESAVQEALQQSIDQGVLTEEQAAWMLDHMSGRYLDMLEYMGTGAMFGLGPGYSGGGFGGTCHGYWNNSNTSSRP